MAVAAAAAASPSPPPAIATSLVPQTLLELEGDEELQQLHARVQLVGQVRSQSLGAKRAGTESNMLNRRFDLAAFATARMTVCCLFPASKAALTRDERVARQRSLDALGAPPFAAAMRVSMCGVGVAKRARPPPPSADIWMGMAHECMALHHTIPFLLTCFAPAVCTPARCRRQA